MNLKIDNYFELLALHKCLMAVKFDEFACLPEAQGSPFVASLAFKVFDLLVKSSIDVGKEQQAEGWLLWQIADENRSETQLLLKQIAKSGWWSSANDVQRIDYIVQFMAPLKLYPDLQSKIVRGS